MHNVVSELLGVCNDSHLGTDARPTEHTSIADRVAASGKVQLLDKLLPRLQVAGQRVLLLCQSNAVRCHVQMRSI